MGSTREVEVASFYMLFRYHCHVESYGSDDNGDNRTMDSKCWTFFTHTHGSAHFQDLLLPFEQVYLTGYLFSAYMHFQSYDLQTRSLSRHNAGRINAHITVGPTSSASRSANTFSQVLSIASFNGLFWTKLPVFANFLRSERRSGRPSVFRTFGV